MSKLLFMPGVGAVENITEMWGGPGALLEAPADEGEYKVFAYEFAAVRSTPIRSTNTLLAIGKAFAIGAAKADYNLDVVGVMVRDGTDLTAGYDVVQVIFQFTEMTWIGNLGKLNAAVQKELSDSSAVDNVVAVKVFRASAPEAKAFSQDGGVAPLFVTRNGKVSTTKAAVDPNPKQIMIGTILDLQSAVPLTGSKSTFVADSEFPWGTVAAVVGVGFLATLVYYGIKGQGVIEGRGSGMEPNASRKRSSIRRVRHKDGRRKMGSVGVDTGQLIIGDPAYFVHKDSGMSSVLKKAMRGEGRDRGFNYKRTGKPGLGYMTSTGWGDGLYPIYATYRDGRVAKLEIDFMGPPEKKSKRRRK